MSDLPTREVIATQLEDASFFTSAVEMGWIGDAELLEPVLRAYAEGRLIDRTKVDLKAGLQAWYGVIGNLSGVYHPKDAEKIRMMAAQEFFDAATGRESSNATTTE